MIDLHPHFWAFFALFVSGGALAVALLAMVAISVLPDRRGAHARSRRRWPRSVRRQPAEARGRPDQARRGRHAVAAVTGTLAVAPAGDSPSAAVPAASPPG